MATVNVRGVELAYDDVGRGSGATVVWGHGLSSSRANEDAFPFFDWATVGRNSRVVRYDARGHGSSAITEDPAGYSWAELAEDQLAVADHLGVDRYVAAGASMGCGTALHAALAAPGRIRGLLLVIPPTAWETRQERAAMWAQVADMIAAKGVERYLQASAALPEPDPFVGRPERREFREKYLRAIDPARLATVFRGAATADLPPREAIATIRVPTKILAWSGDPAHPESTAEALVDLIAGSSLHVARTWDDLGAWTSLAAQFVASLDDD